MIRPEGPKKKNEKKSFIDFTRGGNKIGFFNKKKGAENYPSLFGSVNLKINKPIFLFF